MIDKYKGSFNNVKSDSEMQSCMALDLCVIYNIIMSVIQCNIIILCHDYTKGRWSENEDRLHKQGNPSRKNGQIAFANVFFYRHSAGFRFPARASGHAKKQIPCKKITPVSLALVQKRI